MSPKKSTALSTSKSRLVVWLGHAHLRLVWRREGRVVGVAWKPLQSGWLRNGELLEPRYISQALGEALRELKFSGGAEITWLLPPELMPLRVSEAPVLEGEYLEKALVLEAERLPPDRSEECYVRLGVYPSVGQRRQAVLGKVFRSTLNILRKISEEHRLRLWDVDQTGQALAIRHAAQQKAEGLWALLHLEPGNSSLVFYWGQELVRSRSLVDVLDPWGRQVKGELGLLEALLAREKLEAGEVVARITQVMEETLHRIAQDDLSPGLTKAANEQNLSCLYLSGLGILDQGLRNQLVQEYYFDVVCLEEGIEQGGMYAPLLAALEGERVTRFPLLAQQVDWNGRLRPLFAAGLVVAVLLSLGAGVYALSLNRQIAEEQTQITRLKPEDERQKALLASLNALETKLKALRALTPVDWRAELQPLLLGLPRNDGSLGVGLSRLVILSDRTGHRYSLEGLAVSRAALERFLRYWEGGNNRSVALTRWAKENGGYGFTATVQELRGGGGE